MRHRVVITGIGIYSCIGQNIRAVTDSLYHGKSGIVFDQARKDYGYRSPLAGIVPVPDLKGKLDRRMRVGMAEQAEYAYISSLEAFQNAGIDQDYINSHEMGILFGNDSSAKPVIESAKICNEKKSTIFLGSGAVFQSMNSTVTMNLSSIFKLRGVNMTVSAACASSSHAIGLGYMFIRDGMQDMILCGGAQETNIYSVPSFDALSAFSMRLDEPQKASRPFDAHRDGLVPSGGAASLVLEEYEHAVKRGAKIYAEVTGYGVSSNGDNISLAEDSGCETAIRRSIECAGLTPRDIDYVNAHATSTPKGDAVEATALARVFEGLHTPVSSTKSMTGHECWMAGASEIVYSIIMMENSFIAPNINFGTPDEYSSKLNIIAERTDRKIRTVLSNSFGFGGTNSALIITKPAIL